MKIHKHLRAQVELFLLIIILLNPSTPLHGQQIVLDSLKLPPGFTGSFYAYHVGSVNGDLNGDGVNDLIIGCYGCSAIGSGTDGIVFTIDGSNYTIIDTILSAIPQSAGWFGWSFDAIDDINNDNIRDIIVAAPQEREVGHPARAGRVYIYSGATGQHLRTLVSPYEGTGNNFGYSIAGGADFNGDGVGDHIIGEWKGYIPGSNPIIGGTVHIFSGKTGNLIRTVYSPNDENGGEFGYSVASIDDINADGVKDFAIGARGEELPGDPASSGVAYFFSGANGTVIYESRSPEKSDGGSFGSSIVNLYSDIDYDGVDDIAIAGYKEERTLGTGISPDDAGRVYIYSGKTGKVLISAKSPREQGQGFFGCDLSGLNSDIDGDGINDLIVGAFGEERTNAPLSEGLAYILSGASLDTLITVHSPHHQTNGTFGFSVSTTNADYTGDNLNEILIGATHEGISTSNGGKGRAYILDISNVKKTNVWTGFSSNDWFDPANWSLGIIPNSHTNVLIPNVAYLGYPFPVVMGAPTLNAKCKNITIAKDANIIVSGLNGVSLQIFGTSFNNYGNPNLGNGEIEFFGQPNHRTEINGACSFGYMTIRNYIIIRDTITINTGLELKDGVLNTDWGKLVIASTPSETAYIYDSVGVLQGNVTMQRLITNNGFNYLGSPVLGATIQNDWGASFNISTLNGAQDGDQVITDPTCSALAVGSPYGTLFDWYEKANITCQYDGWRIRTNGNLTPTDGYIADLISGTLVEVTGTYVTGPQLSDFLTVTYGNPTSSQGMALIANPYASEISTDSIIAENALNNNRIDGNLYIYQTHGSFAGTYKVFNAANSGTIPSSSSFFVRAINHRTKVRFWNSMRQRNGVSNNQFPKSSLANYSQIQLIVEGNGFADKTQILFGTMFTHDFEIAFDALKLNPKVGQPNLSTIADSNIFSIIALPYFDSVYTQKLNFVPGESGSFKISMLGFSTLKPNTLVYIEDKLDNTYHLLNDDSSYLFTASTDDLYERFRIHFISLPNDTITNTLLPKKDTNLLDIWYFDEKLFIKLYQDIGLTPIIVEINNPTGQKILHHNVYTPKNVITTLDVNFISSGLYFTRIQFGSNVKSYKFMVP